MASKKVRTPVNFSESNGYRYLHFGSEWIQGGMQIKHPYQLSLKYQQYMTAFSLFMPHPRKVLQLGLGAGGFAKFCWKYLPEAQSTVVEISEDVYFACKMWFKLPNEDERLKIVFDDCREFLIKSETDAYDWLFVDIYDAQAWGPVYDDTEFYGLCRKVLKDGGVASFNVFGGEDFKKSYDAISAGFEGRMLVMPEIEEGNRIVLATKGDKKTHETHELMERAAEIETGMKLPAKSWIRLLQKENGFEGAITF